MPRLLEGKNGLRVVVTSGLGQSPTSVPERLQVVAGSIAPV